MNQPIRISTHAPLQTRLFIECTSTFFSGGNSGIQRVVRNLVNHNLNICSAEVITTPIIWTGGSFYRLTSKLTVNGPLVIRLKNRIKQFLDRNSHRQDRLLSVLGTIARLFLPGKARNALVRISRELVFLGIGLAKIPVQMLFGRPVRFRSGDIVVLVDSTWQTTAMLSYLFKAQHDPGISLVAMIHDLFPLTLPHTCAESTVQAYRQWFKRLVPRADFFLTNSESTRTALMQYLQEHPQFRPNDCVSASFRLGAELDQIRLQNKQSRYLSTLWELPGTAILSIGTIEPRKNYGFLLDAYDLLRQEDMDVSLIIVGRSGWKNQELLARIKGHHDYGTRLLHLDSASDRDLIDAITRSDCLVCPSIAEGFGLPVVEGLMYELEVFASDIPPFREIGAGYCRFFSLDAPESLSDAIQRWLSETVSSNGLSGPKGFAWPNWEVSAREFVRTTLQLTSA